jgi:hypothetical protein
VSSHEVSIPRISITAILRQRLGNNLHGRIGL